jgi:hypothetical protein
MIGIGAGTEEAPLTVSAAALLVVEPTALVITQRNWSPDIAAVGALTVRIAPSTPL